MEEESIGICYNDMLIGHNIFRNMIFSHIELFKELLDERIDYISDNLLIVGLYFHEFSSFEKYS